MHRPEKIPETASKHYFVIAWPAEITGTVKDTTAVMM
jgi:hypothetical protein